MLNEGYDLLQALKAAGIALPSYQKSVVTPGKSAGPCLRVRLRQDSSISSIEVLAEEEWPGLWAIREGNNDSRPVVRLTVPLLQVPLNDNWWKSIGYTDRKKRENVTDSDKLSALKSALDTSSWFQSFTMTNGDKNRNNTAQTWNRIRNKGKEFSDSLSVAEDLVNVQRVFKRFGQLPDMQDFAACLRSIVKEQLKDGTLPVALVETLLVGERKLQGGEWTPPSSKVQLAFDIDKGATIYHKVTKTALEKMLETQNRSAIEDEPDSESMSRCAFGSDGPLQASAFPNPQLPVVAEKGMSLVSMFSEAHANTRYGLTDSAIVPVGQRLVSQMAQALRWVTSDERQGKTWRGVSSGIFDKSREQRDLFIAYVTGKPQIDAAIANFFGENQDSLDKQFAVDSKAVCDALNTIVREIPASKLRVFALRQVSPGQVQIVLSRTLDPAKIVTGAALWSKGSENLPPIFVPLPKEKGKPPENGSPMAPYPDQVVRILSQQWIREGAKKDKQEPCMPVRGPSLGSIIDLLVREPGKYENVARDLLKRCLIQVGPLLKGLGGAIRTKDRKRHEHYPLKNRYQALIAYGTIGLVLHALNSQKENYMQNSAFAVGKMLALADDIHRSYCEVVRKGSIPPSLLGNSLLSTAMENPTRAIAVLGDRLKIYIGWAKTAKAAEASQISIRTARNRLAQYGSFVESISDQGLPTTMDDVTKAHLMLGYLASTNKEKTEGGQENE